MSFQETDRTSSTRLWALEPAVTPLPAGWALVIGFLFGTLLVVISLGTAPQSAVEDWHGNVAASSGIADTTAR